MRLIRSSRWARAASGQAAAAPPRNLMKSRRLMPAPGAPGTHRSTRSGRKPSLAFAPFQSPAPGRYDAAKSRMQIREELMGERIVMLGAGAVGGYVGGHLALHGHDVTLIDFWSENVEAIRKNGLELSGMTPEERQVLPPKTLPR